MQSEDIMCKVGKINHSMWQTSKKSLLQWNHRCAVTKRYSNNNNVNIHTCSNVYSVYYTSRKNSEREWVFVRFAFLITFPTYHTTRWQQSCKWQKLFAFRCWFRSICYIECFVMKMNLCVSFSVHCRIVQYLAR